MASDIFIKIDGIKGESQDSKHPDEIEVMSWSWGISNAGSAHVGSGQGQGGSRADVQDIHIQKSVDVSTLPLMTSCLTGKHIPKAVLVMRKPSGDEPLEYMTITMEDIVVTSISQGGADGGGAPSESLSLNFAKVKLKYVTQLADGGKGVQPELGWDIRAHKSM